MPKFKIRFTPDSKRRGQIVDNLESLRAARREIRGERPTFTPQGTYGYPKSWEVTCGDTVVAYVYQLPRGAGVDYYPTYRIGRNNVWWPCRRR